MTLEELKEILTKRLRGREIYAEQNPLNDVYYKGLQKGALSEIEFLTNLLKQMEGKDNV